MYSCRDQITLVKDHVIKKQITCRRWNQTYPTIEWDCSHKQVLKRRCWKVLGKVYSLQLQHKISLHGKHIQNTGHEINEVPERWQVVCHRAIWNNTETYCSILTRISYTRVHRTHREANSRSWGRKAGHNFLDTVNSTFSQVWVLDISWWMFSKRAITNYFLRKCTLCMHTFCNRFFAAIPRSGKNTVIVTLTLSQQFHLIEKYHIAAFRTLLPSSIQHLPSLVP